MKETVLWLKMNHHLDSSIDAQEDLNVPRFAIIILTKSFIFLLR